MHRVGACGNIYVFSGTAPSRGGAAERACGSAFRWHGYVSDLLSLTWASRRQLPASARASLAAGSCQDCGCWLVWEDPSRDDYKGCLGTPRPQ
jgi:hypothetical protein